MLDDVVFKTDDVSLENLEYLAEQMCVTEEQRLLEISDISVTVAKLWRELRDMGLGVLDILAFLFGGVDLGSYRTDEVMTENRVRIRRRLAELKNYDKAAFSEMLLDALGREEIFLFEGDFLPAALTGESFTYVRNALADEAYDVFSQDFDDPRVVYSSDFRECARRVSEGDCAFCLLPLEERGGTRLPSVSELIYRNDLKINSVTPVFGYDGSADMKYALVSKGFILSSGKAGDDRYLEIRLGEKSEVSLGNLLSAAELYGHTVYRVNTVVFDTEGEREPFYSVVLKDEDRDFTAILTYLTLFSGDFIPVGIYKNLE